MSKQDWDLKTKKEEIALHLKKEHAFPFNDRRSLTVQDFIFEHFPSMVRLMCDKEYGYLNKGEKECLSKSRIKLTEALKECELKGIAIAKVFDFNESNEGEWRICKPTKEQLSYLKFKRWFTSAEGFFNKALLQESMIGEADIEELISELRATIKQKQELRAIIKKKRKIKVKNEN